MGKGKYIVLRIGLSSEEREGRVARKGKVEAVWQATGSHCENI